MDGPDVKGRDFPEEPTKKTDGQKTGQESTLRWLEQVYFWWSKQPFGIKAAILSVGIGGSVFLTVFTIGRLHTSPSPALSVLSNPGQIGIRSRSPIRSISASPSNVAGIQAAGEPALRNFQPPPSSPPASLGQTSSPSSQTLYSFPSQSTPSSAGILDRQMGAIVVEIASLSEAVRTLSAENAALLKGQEWIERTMSRGRSLREGQRAQDRSQNSTPLADDRPTGSSSSSPVLGGWRVIGVSGTGAVLVDPSGQDHLVRKGRELQGVAVTGIDPETGAVAFSDGEVLRP